MITLDTNIVIALQKGREPSLRDRLPSTRGNGTIVALSSVVLFELSYGAEKGMNSQKRLAWLDNFLREVDTVWPFDADDAHEAARIRVELETERTPIGPFDLLIAAQARRRGATLVTRNSAEYSRVRGLVVTDWRG